MEWKTPNSIIGGQSSFISPSRRQALHNESNTKARHPQITLFGSLHEFVGSKTTLFWSLHEFVSSKITLFWSLHEFVGSKTTLFWSLHKFVSSKMTTFWSLHKRVTTKRLAFWSLQTFTATSPSRVCEKTSKKVPSHRHQACAHLFIRENADAHAEIVGGCGAKRNVWNHSDSRNRAKASDQMPPASG